MVIAICYDGINELIVKGIQTDKLKLFGNFEGIFISLPIISFAFTFHSNIFYLERNGRFLSWSD